ncbi:helix-turn-helix transcriptional regulator [Chryseobacterium sp. SSA4.19]|uniref:helix-turn-helix domain-containing protein n=1 Tax=Chryseobacterium sp. SSA4.19 TaxID=2919915 RepID=UPI001F4EA79A|nr:helix-turn-helix transcriptional regulator [Chryseobacterium sp. SSA4.19]MCJ8153703.1 helix-turn-helix transcriptional regulator [Chryseobacterium sp. SSA4.19]
MSELRKIREEQNLTQEELAGKSGLSVRTIQRIESGISPKGYTLKALASGLGIAEKDLLTPDFPEEEPAAQEPVSVQQEAEMIHYSMVKIINLSSIPFAWFPVANFILPVSIMLFTKQKSSIVKQIISVQILAAVMATVIFMIVVLMKLGSGSVLITMILLTLANLYIILRNAYEIDKSQQLYYNLNFSVI